MLLYGTQHALAVGVSTALAEGDFETYCEAGLTSFHKGELLKWRSTQKNKPGLKSVGSWVYSRHPSCEVNTFVYNLRDGGPYRMWYPGLANPTDLFAHIAAGGLFEAVNSFFEYSICTNVCTPKYGWPLFPLAQFRDTGAKALAWSMANKLEAMCDILDTPIKKSKEGHAEMMALCKPRNQTKTDARTRYTRENAPDKHAKQDAYCVTDVQSEGSCSERLPDLSARETDIFLIDQAINARGCKVDMPLVKACIDLIHQVTPKYNTELSAITGGMVRTSDQLDNMKAFLATRGCHTTEITKDSVPLLLAGELHPEARRVLDIRVAMGSKSVAKTFAMLYTADPEDHRIRGMYQYCGAPRTRRWSGRGAQPQNMPKDGPAVVRCLSCEAVHWAGINYCPNCLVIGEGHPCDWGIEAAEACIPALMSRDLAYVEGLWGDVLTAIAGCLRSFFIAAAGCRLLSSDYTAIEAVVVSILAGEEWVTEVFRTHGLIYEMTASQLTGVPFEEFVRFKAEEGRNHPYRKLGKVAFLSSSYEGGLLAWKSFGAGKFMSDEEIYQNGDLWKEANPNIVKLWAGLEGAAIAATQHPGQPYAYHMITYQLLADNVLYAMLPSGRAIPYHSPKVSEIVWKGKPKLQLTFLKALHGKFVRSAAFGGMLTGHVTSATARDIMADAMVRLEHGGYPLVMHLHDEPIAELPHGQGSVARLEAIMLDFPSWCADWPIKADGGWEGQRYRKA